MLCLTVDEISASHIIVVMKSFGQSKYGISVNSPTCDGVSYDDHRLFQARLKIFRGPICVLVFYKHAIIGLSCGT